MNLPDEHAHPSPNDHRLGMNESISRRDFVNGTLVAAAGMLLNGRASAMGTSPADAWIRKRPSRPTASVLLSMSCLP